MTGTRTTRVPCSQADQSQGEETEGEGERGREGGMVLGREREGQVLEQEQDQLCMDIVLLW